MRIQTDPLLPTTRETEGLTRRMTALWRDISRQVNALSEGGISAITNASTAAPTTGTWAQGDFVRNSQPAEAGTAGSKYVVFGWICTASGTPGTWLPCRMLTGN